MYENERILVSEIQNCHSSRLLPRYDRFQLNAAHLTVGPIKELGERRK